MKRPPIIGYIVTMDGQPAEWAPGEDWFCFGDCASVFKRRKTAARYIKRSEATDEEKDLAAALGRVLRLGAVEQSGERLTAELSSLGYQYSGPSYRIVRIRAAELDPQGEADQ